MNFCKQVGRGCGVVIVMGWLCCASLVDAQTPPGDLTELSLEQILSLPIVKRSAPLAEPMVASRELSRWSVGYRYLHVSFSGHRDGTDSLTNEELLVPPGSTLGDRAFLILPTNIRQEAHVLEVGYRASDRLAWTLLVPYIFQSTEHVSSVPAFSEFTIDSDGVGDISVTPSLQVWDRGPHSVEVNLGASIPVGSISEKGDTPSGGPGDLNQLPYTMQIGSGTLDLLPGVAYRGTRDRWHWTLQAQATLRLGKNFHNYSLGNRYVFAGRLGRVVSDWFEPTIGLRFQHWESIDGEGPGLPPGPPYAATVADPRRYGGQKMNISVGARMQLDKSWLRLGTIEFSAGLPIYQRLNGPQPEEQWQLSGAWKLGF